MGLSISPNIYKKKMSAILLFWHGKCNLFHWQYCTYHERILWKSFEAIGWDTTSGGIPWNQKDPWSNRDISKMKRQKCIFFSWLKINLADWTQISKLAIIWQFYDQSGHSAPSCWFHLKIRYEWELVTWWGGCINWVRVQEEDAICGCIMIWWSQLSHCSLNHTFLANHLTIALDSHMIYNSRLFTS
jgi:hypothetical protein